jgi:uncharacterized protein
MSEDRPMAKLRQFFSGSQAGGKDTRLRLLNRTRNSQIASSVEVADSGGRRSKGLLGRTGLDPGTGIWIVPCEAVHTFGMRFPIDLIYLDRNLKIRKLRSSVGPWRLSGCLTAHSVVELPAGAIQTNGAQVGDTVEFLAIEATGGHAEDLDLTPSGG